MCGRRSTATGTGGLMSFDYNKDLPQGVAMKIIAAIVVILLMMVGVAVYTVRKIDTPPTNGDRHSEIRPVKSVPGPPVPQKDRPEYSPPEGQGSSRAREN